MVSGYLSQQDANVGLQVQVALLRKAQDQMKLQGAAMVNLIDQAGLPGSVASSPPPLLDVYA